MAAADKSIHFSIATCGASGVTTIYSLTPDTEVRLTRQIAPPNQDGKKPLHRTHSRKIAKCQSNAARATE